MLSRIAESMFWIGRYVERAEDTARLLQTHLRLIIEETAAHEVDACRNLLALMSVDHLQDPTLTEVLRMGTADAQQALRLVRRNAAAWRIDPARVGIMGFSAGGGIAVGTALADKSDASPDFLISVYGPSLQDVDVPAHAPPLFIAVGSTHFNVTNGCLALFAVWKAAGKPAEIHVYDQVSAGFGMSTRGLPVDTWNERLLDWMVARKLTRR